MCSLTAKIGIFRTPILNFQVLQQRIIHECANITLQIMLHTVLYTHPIQIALSWTRSIQTTRSPLMNDRTKQTPTHTDTRWTYRVERQSLRINFHFREGHNWQRVRIWTSARCMSSIDECIRERFKFSTGIMVLDR